MSEPIHDAFILTRDWRDGPKGAVLTLWCWSPDGPIQVSIDNARAVCFVDREARVPDGWRCTRRPVELRTAVGDPVDALYFATQRDLNGARERAGFERVRLFESDVRAADRYLMERFVRGGVRLTGTPVRQHGVTRLRNPKLRGIDVEPDLATVSLDIETDGFDGEVYSIALAGTADRRVLMVSAEPVAADDIVIDHHPDERALLCALVDWLMQFDPDVILGWNLIGFDLTALEKRFAINGVPFALGRDRENARILQGSNNQPAIALIPGRVAIDGIESLRAAFYNFEDFSLEGVARTLLGRGKLIDEPGDRLESIQRMAREDKPALARYNLEDCALVNDIVAATNLVDLAVSRTRLTGLGLGRLGGSVASLDNLYLPLLHRKGRVAFDVGDGATGGAGSPGGHVLDSAPGIYRNVALLDFKSLYPSIIRTFRIDPFGLWEPGEDPVEGFLGATFRREGAILPALVDELWDARDVAKQRRQGALSQAIKIIMNAFYGVLGSSGCRFHDPRLASSITRRGHEVLGRSRDFLEADGHKVIYGDTDSLFVLLDESLDADAARERGAKLAVRLNDFWQETIASEHRVASCLEVEFETLFARFLMPTLRGSALGSKKRYAGIAVEADGTETLIFKGLESVRTDWTLLARRFQRELYERVFRGEPHEAFVKTTLEDLLAGRLDHELVYAKRLRRNVEEYRGAPPPQVQAARLAGQRSGWVRYVITREGPRVVEGNTAAIDYEHYRERQLAPVADGILHFLGTSFADLTDRQLAIF